MDLSKQVEIKTYTGQRLSYFDLAQSIRCIDLISTPLEGDATLDLELVDFGPLLIIKRINHRAAIEDIQYGADTLACQLPCTDDKAIESFLSLPGGDRYNPFQMPGSQARWLVPQGVSFFHIQFDQRWLEQVLGHQTMQDYQELCKAPSRRAYDESLFVHAAVAAQKAMDTAYDILANNKVMNKNQLEALATDILLPCIMSDIEEIKESTRQKILSKAMDYIRDNHQKTIRLADMASMVSTSVRNLQMVFKQELGVSPSKYIQQFRLHRFRHQLPLSSSVTEAAYNSGFKHLGRLTEQYAKVFDNYPSEDLSAASTMELDFGLQL
jgi:methylphosphotriester-DNA--protein-cysteine methyltransferase